jgi:hypothetical protein
LTFEHIEDIDEENVLASGIDVAAPITGTTVKSKTPRTVWELEEASQSGLVFQLFCFFQNRHTLQGEL